MAHLIAARGSYTHRIISILWRPGKVWYILSLKGQNGALLTVLWVVLFTWIGATVCQNGSSRRVCHWGILLIPRWSKPTRLSLRRFCQKENGLEEEFQPQCSQWPHTTGDLNTYKTKVMARNWQTLMRWAQSLNETDYKYWIKYFSMFKILFLRIIRIPGRPKR